MNDKVNAQIESILEYWYKMEFFAPVWPCNSKDIELKKETFPWQTGVKVPSYEVYYDIYAGKVVAGDLIKWALKALNIAVEDTKIEQDLSGSCVFAYKVDEEGVYYPESFTIGSFVWSISTMVKNSKFNTPLNTDDLKALEAKFDKLFTETTVDNYNDLEEQLSTILQELSIDKELCQYTFWAKDKKYKVNADGTTVKVNAGTELLTSFYTEDIQRVRNHMTARVSRFVAGLIRDNPHRAEIDTDTSHMKKALRADAYPMGKWPSKHSPSLMQQISINLSIANKDIFSVNGPPGTGKTTLLKEVIASHIVDRAKILSGYENPKDAFRKKMYSDPPDKFSPCYYIPDPALIPYGVLVASNNNAAVENISKELPKSISESLTGKFAWDGEADIYFSDVGGELLGEEAWGLISARLGKKSNVEELTERLMGNKGKTIMEHFKNPEKPDWQECRREFDRAYQAVLNERASILQAQHLVEKYPEIKTRYETALDKKIEAQQAFELVVQDKETCEKSIRQLNRRLGVIEDNIQFLQSSLPFYKRWFAFFFKADRVVMEIRSLKVEHEDLLIEKTRTYTALLQHENDVHSQQKALKAQEWRLAEEERALGQYQDCLENERNRFGRNFGDDHFWENIESNEASQMACPWTTSEYDEKREELFYQAIRLQKAFVLNCNCVKQNINRLQKLWGGSFCLKDKEESYGALLNTLFLWCRFFQQRLQLWSGYWMALVWRNWEH